MVSVVFTSTKKCGTLLLVRFWGAATKEKNPFDRYAIAAMKWLPRRLADCTIGHLPREISRVIRFFLLRGGVVSVEIVDKNRRRSPIVQGGLEISMKLMAEIDASEKNEAIMKRLKQLITDSYKEPDVEGKFEDCTEKIQARWVRWWGIRACVNLKFEPTYSCVNS